MERLLYTITVENRTNQTVLFPCTRLQVSATVFSSLHVQLIAPNSVTLELETEERLRASMRTRIITMKPKQKWQETRTIAIASLLEARERGLDACHAHMAIRQSQIVIRKLQDAQMQHGEAILVPLQANVALSNSVHLSLLQKTVN